MNLGLIGVYIIFTASVLGRAALAEPRGLPPVSIPPDNLQWQGGQGLVQ
jgi:hypothetical protein